ncbi:MAG: putative metal-binding motif-containing protein [Alphaproteobacteria bacterium]|nr:putative metal-binding motif-containing protein [Alphaproteobacteria bacterium]
MHTLPSVFARVSSLWLVGLALVGGCVFIDRGAQDAKIQAICTANPDDPGCEPIPTVPPPTPPTLIDCYTDGDGDGFGAGAAVPTETACAAGLVASGTDCDDADGDIHPEATEICGNAVDEDCDGTAGQAVTVYLDHDQDGFGAGEPVAACQPGPGFSTVAGDCDDTDAGIGPTATEVPADGIDQDCDGFESCPVDLDGDGFFSSALLVDGDLGCAGITGPEDCLDLDASVYPGALEIVGDGIDQSCDGIELCYTDADDDGFGDAGAPLLETTQGIDCVAETLRAAVAGDCDDTAADVSPGAPEDCNDGIDHDCSGDPGSATWFRDADGDGFGDATDSVGDCLAPAGYIAVSGDCDDSDADVHPAAIELPADGVDQNCNGTEICYADLDDDGYGSGTVPGTLACDGPLQAPLDGDCDDACDLCTPGAEEVCDALDNDCDGLVDVGATDIADWFADADGDGWGTSASVAACFQPSGHANRAGDCDDADPDVNPGEQEVCGDGLDNNCNPDDDLAGAQYWTDADGDGHGAGTPVTTCTPGATQVTNGDDCDDTQAARFPGNPVIVVGDGLDNDCDGFEECYRDLDGDGFAGDASAIVDGPDATTCTGEATVRGDCAVNDPLIHPAATETAGNNVDEDCDGMRLCYVDADVDTFGAQSGTTQLVSSCSNGFSVNTLDCDDTTAAVNPAANDIVGNALDENCNGTWTCFRDADGDLYAVSGTSELTMVCPTGVQSGDCNDGAATVHPGATEVCNGVDDDCSNGVPTDETDPDGDGYVECAPWSGSALLDGGDCAPTDGSVSPGLPETGDNDVDEDCDGQWQCYADGDLDGYGGTTSVTVAGACSSQAGVTPFSTDCDDSTAAVSPAATEVCNGIDDDCDGSPDADEANGDGDAFMVCEGDCDDTNGQIYPGAPEHCDGVDESCGTDTEAGLLSIGAVNYATFYDAWQASVDGDVIHLCGGGAEFPANLLTGAEIELRGHEVANQRPLVVADFPFYPMVLVQTNGLVTVSGVDFDGRDESRLTNGGCLTVDQGVARLVDVTFTGCRTDLDGGAIHVSQGALEATDVVVSDSSAAGVGGGIGCIRCSLVLDNVDVFGNTASSGGGLSAEGYFTVQNEIRIIGGSFVDNVATNRGGAMEVYSKIDLDADGVEIAGNQAQTHGGLYLGWGAHRIVASDIHDNTGVVQSAAIGITEGASISTLVLDGTDIHGHTGVPALRLGQAATVTVQGGSSIYDNDTGAQVVSSGVLVNVVGSSWNVTGADNTDDVLYGASSYQQPAGDAAFTCNSSGCTSP